MSADNGIYILQTLKDSAPGEPTESYGFEYRVRELQAIDNLEYDENVPMPVNPHNKDDWHSSSEMLPEDHPKYKEHEEYRKANYAKYASNNPDVRIANAREMWKGCKVFYTKESAMEEASKIEQKITEGDFCYFLEYGISTIRINRVF